MTVDQAIAIHMQWKETFALHVRLEERLGEILLERIRHEDQCALGRWIASADMVKWSTRVEFFELKIQHTNFHRQMLKVATALGEDSFGEAATLIAAGSAFEKVSARLTKAIRGMGQI
jgi:hypothetical protein